MRRRKWCREARCRVVIAFVAFTVLLAAGPLEKLPLVVVYVYVVMSGIAFFAYAFDKSAARSGRWRTKESSLHALAFFGGWPGALMAQGVFRHKSRKAEFLVMFWITAIANCGLLVWILRADILRG